MSQPTTIARPYARAAFESAREHDTVAAWSDMLAAIKQWLANDAARRAVGNPLFSAQAIADVVVGSVDALDARMQNFVRLLAANHRLPLIPHIAALFEEYRAQSEQRIDAQVVSAMPLDEHQQQSLVQALGRRLNAEVVLHCSLDRTLLAGAIIRAGRLSIDGSLKSRLHKLSAALNVPSPT